MTFTTLSSGSFANGYILSNGQETLLIEAGCPLMDVKKALGFDLKTVRGLILTHLHGDHSKYIRQYLNSGITVYSGAETLESLGVSSHHNAIAVESGKGFIAGGFKVLPLEAEHDVPCLMFHINHQDIGNMLFMTDTVICPYSFKNLNTICIEANYADDIIDDNVMTERIHPSQRFRTMTNHMGLETVKEILMSNDLSSVRTVVLLHLSNRNSDEERFVREIEGVTGKQVYIASRGTKIDLNINPY